MNQNFENSEKNMRKKTETKKIQYFFKYFNKFKKENKIYFTNSTISII